MKTQRKRLIAILTVPIVVLFVILWGVYALYRAGFRLNRDINESGNTTYSICRISEITNQVDTMNQRFFIHFVDKENKYTKSLNDLGISLRPTEYTKGIFVQDNDVTYSYDINQIQQTVKDLNNNRSVGAIGKLIETDEGIRLEGQTKCTLLNREKLSNDIAVWISSLKGVNSDTLEIKLTDYYTDHILTPEEQEIQKQYQRYADFSIQYTSGAIIDSDICYKEGLIKLENEHIVATDSEDDIKIIQDLCKQKLYGYNTVGNTYNFITHDGENIQVDSVTYGDYIDYDEEASYIQNLVQNFISETNRTPVMKQTAYSSIDDTYIEVDIKGQHAYYYKNRELLWDSDIVTGKMTKERQTHTGIFFIFNKAKNIHLQK